MQTSWGYCGRENGIKILAQPDIHVLICGETREWELVEYCRDSISSGNEALIVVGHVLSEQGGMILCRDWLMRFCPEVPVGFSFPRRNRSGSASSAKDIERAQSSLGGGLTPKKQRSLITRAAAGRIEPRYVLAFAREGQNSP